MRTTFLLSIVLLCILGSCGHFDSRAQGLSVDICEEWIKTPSALRIMVLRYGIMTELRKSNLEEEETESLIECLSEYNSMKDLDKTIVDKCHKGKEENLANVFDKSLERMVFRCLKWINGEKE